MTSSAVVEYLEKYSVAPSPSRDYYGIKVLRDQVILYTWKVSHGPHHSPIVRTTSFFDFCKEKTMQNEIERVFGEPTFRHVEAIARGNERTLLTLPKHLIKKLITYLTFKDVLNLSTLSHMAKEVFNGDTVWEVLYKRHKMGLVYKDERVQGSSYGWKRLFKERQMHKSARNRKIKNLSSDQHLIAPRSSTALTRRSSASSPLKNHRETVSATKLISTEMQALKFPAWKSSLNYNGRPDTANKKKSNVDITRCKLLEAKRDHSDNDLFAKTETLKSLRESEKDLSVNFKSTTIGGREGKSISKGTSGNETKNSDEKTGSEQTSAVSNIVVGKHSDQNSECSVKKFANFQRKSNPSRAGVDENHKTVAHTESLARRCEKKAFRNDTKKSNSKIRDSKNSGRSEISKTKKPSLGNDHGVSSVADFGLEELIRASITEEYTNSDNLLPPGFWRDRTFEASSNVARRSAQKCSNNKPNFRTVEKTPNELKKKSNELVAAACSPAEIPAKKSTDIKVYLKCNRKNFCRDESKVGNYIMEEKSSSTKGMPQNIVAKYKNRAFLKTESCDSHGSKFIATKSSQGLGPKKQGNSEKL